jgi:hypothetical protein
MTAPRSSQGGIRTGAEVTAQTTRRSCRGVTHPDGSGTYATGACRTGGRFAAGTAAPTPCARAINEVTCRWRNRHTVDVGLRSRCH